MKKWKCSICGYLYEGDAPPETCPVCGSPKEMFKELASSKSEDSISQTITDRTADILVIGSGAAAFSAAVTARSKGASVIMLEKAEQLGGTTARSGGGHWIPNNKYQKAAGYNDNKEDCLRYMSRLSYPHLYNPNAENFGIPKREYTLLEAYYNNASQMIDYFDSISALKSYVEINWTGKAQVDYQNELPENKNIRGRTIYPQNSNGDNGTGVDLIRQLKEWAASNDVQMLTGCEVTRIVQDNSGRVSGVEVLMKGEKLLFSASKGIIFGSGGYSHNPEYMLQFQRGPHFGGCSVPTNTGDFIRMAGEIGARVGNTAGAFRAQSMIEVAFKNPGGSSNVFYLPGDSMLLVNKYGKRVVDEKRNYTDRTMAHFVWDAGKAEWINMLTFMIFDQRTASLWQGFPPFPIQTADKPDYLIKGNKIEEVASEIKRRLNAMSGRIGGFNLDDSFLDGLKDTIRRYNIYAETGKDLEFQRGESYYDKEWTTFPPTVPNGKWPNPDSKNYTMYPISDEGPYYAVILAAGTLDTNGGPVIDNKARVLDWNDKPIEGLYGAGNCIASPSANAYWGAGGTIGPGMTFGYIAALDALD